MKFGGVIFEIASKAELARIKTDFRGNICLPSHVQLRTQQYSKMRTVKSNRI